MSLDDIKPRCIFAKANHGNLFGGSLALEINVVPVQLQKLERINNSPQVVFTYFESGVQILEGWKSDEQLGWYYLGCILPGRRTRDRLLQPPIERA